MATIKGVFLNPDGRLRAAWQLAITWLCWLALSIGGAFIVSRLLLGLFSSWGVNNATIGYAPAWVQYLAAYQHQLMGAVPAVIAACAGLLVIRFYRSNVHTGRLATAAAFSGGAMLAMALMGLFLMTDSMRLVSHIPVFRVDMLLLLIFSLITAAAEGTVAFGYMRNMALTHSCPTAAHALSAITFLVMNIMGATSVLHGVNLLLIGLALSLLAEKHGFIACIALRTGWLWATSALAGFPGSTRGMLTLYPVSEHIITGSFNGPEAGILITIITAAAVLPPMVYSITKRLRAK